MLILQAAHLLLTLVRKLYKSRCFCGSCCGWQLTLTRTPSASSDDSPPQAAAPRQLRIDIPENTPLNDRDDSAMYQTL